MRNSARPKLGRGSRRPMEGAPPEVYVSTPVDASEQFAGIAGYLRYDPNPGSSDMTASCKIMDAEVERAITDGVAGVMGLFAQKTLALSEVIARIENGR